MCKKKTQEEYVAELAEKKPNVSLVGKYIDAKTKTTHKCAVHDLCWEVSPDSVLHNGCCPICHSEHVSKTKTKTQQQYIEEVKRKNPDIDVIGEYIGAKYPIMHRCKIHNIEWEAIPSNILRGHGCKECMKDALRIINRKDHDQYVNELKERFPYIEIVGDYEGAKNPILHYCSKHDILWSASPTNMLNGCGCPECIVEKMRQTNGFSHDEYVCKVSTINPNITVIGQYVNTKTKILHKCLVDGYEWEAEPANILSGTGCPKCNESRGEKRIRLWLENNHISYIPQYKFEDCRNIFPLLFDFYLTDFNKCIEYDGEQHFRPIDFFGGEKGFSKTKERDEIKNLYCLQNNIPLLRIAYFEDIEEKLNNFLFI